MFDYQAGEKYKMTLIVVGVVGMMAGVTLTVFLSPTPDAPKGRPRTKADSHPDITGVAPTPGGYQAPNDGGQPAYPPPVDKANMVDATKATEFVKVWLPNAMDFNAASAAGSQQSAMNYMTPECLSAYKENVWSPDAAEGVTSSGMKSTWQQTIISARPNQPDGSIEIAVEGTQKLLIPGAQPTERKVKFVYLVKKVGTDLKIAGISEG
jgi:hypothetical protein